MNDDTMTGGMDAARWAGVLTLGALGVLVMLRRGFAGVSVRLGD